MTGVLVELCAGCDAERPADAAFIRWLRDPDRDWAAVSGLFDDWAEHR